MNKNLKTFIRCFLKGFISWIILMLIYFFLLPIAVPSKEYWETVNLLWSPVSIPGIIRSALMGIIIFGLFAWALEGLKRN